MSAGSRNASARVASRCDEQNEGEVSERSEWACVNWPATTASAGCASRTQPGAGASAAQTNSLEHFEGWWNPTNCTALGWARRLQPLPLEQARVPAR